MNYIQDQIAQQSHSKGIEFNCVVSDMLNSSLEFTQYDQSSWLLDSEASSYVVNSLDLFTSYTLLLDIFDILPNKSKVKVMAIGTVKLNSDILLVNVLYIPSFTINLISVSQLMKISQFP